MTDRHPGARIAALPTALLCLAAAAALAVHHPVAPWWALAAVVAWSLAAWRPGLWLFVVPAALPVLNFAPWTGWLVVEEFDLLLLATAAGGYARQAFHPWPELAARLRRSRVETAFIGAALLFGLAGAVSLGRGFHAAGGVGFGWFQGYTDPLNGWRVFKSAAFAALLWPLLRQAIRTDAALATRRLATGVATGLTIVTLAVVWERAAYPGLWNYSGPYRTTALFWEMHVGGAAIDAYLALATPFVAWALWSAGSARHWAAAAALALLTGYACLTTFSRGVYFGVAVPLALLGVLIASRQEQGMRRVVVLRTLAAGAMLVGVALALGLAFEVGGHLGSGGLLVGLLALAWALGRAMKPGWRSKIPAMALTLALLLEVVAVFGPGSFMQRRLAASDTDAGSRLGHWRHGLGLMRDPADWLWGIGAGRLPAEYAAHVPTEGFPGTVQFRQGGPGQGAVELLGPRSSPIFWGLLSLTQRIALRPGPAHRLEFDVQATAPADVYVSVCEMHLLYPRDCQQGFFHVDPGLMQWRHRSVPLHGGSLTAGSAAWPRRAVFSIAVVNPGGAARFDNFSLLGPDRAELLVNGGFSAGLAHWLPVARRNFVPWHIDNLVLELLIERGLPALLAFIACGALALWRLLGPAGRATPIAPFIATSLCGAFSVGLVSSVMDVPRVAFLLLLLMIFSVELIGERLLASGRAPARRIGSVPEAAVAAARLVF